MLSYFRPLVPATGMIRTHDYIAVSSHSSAGARRMRNMGQLTGITHWNPEGKYMGIKGMT